MTISTVQVNYVHPLTASSHHLAIGIATLLEAVFADVGVVWLAIFNAGLV